MNEAAGSTRARRSRNRLAVDLTLLGLVGVLLVAAVAAGVATLYREFYSPTAFVERYLSLLADGHAAEALALPGVAVDTPDLEGAGLPPTASDALLRRDALASLSDVEVVSETEQDGVSRVAVTYRAGGVDGRTTFSIERDGTIGVAPTWRFAESPLAVMDLVVRGSMSFDVNGFEIDKRQVSPDGLDADPLAPVSLLVFSPAFYSVSVDTAISSTAGVGVLSDSPFSAVAVDVQAEPTEEFVAVVQQRVEEFLTSCATQQVLQPTACPFGFYVQERIASEPVWSIVAQPVITLVPDGAAWVIPDTEAIAHIDVDIRSLFDGSVRSVSEDVPFVLTALITVLPDGTATITVGGPGLP
ncbi:hypothetical protein ACFC3F_04145 [Microbacterium sp. NPDC055910]|uniref:hypothetical protein n=1 Tax=Microbacterium sp. NPDC055910 TaxID=3345659 RepID=UPI0035D8DEAB